MTTIAVEAYNTLRLLRHADTIVQRLEHVEMETGRYSNTDVAVALATARDLRAMLKADCERAAKATRET